MRRNGEKETKENGEQMRRRMENQRRELEKLRQELAQVRAGAAQLQTAVDGVLTAATLAFGRETGEGEKELKLPRFSTSELNRAYVLRARREAEGKGYVLKVLPRQKEGEAVETGGEKDRKTKG